MKSLAVPVEAPMCITGGARLCQGMGRPGKASVPYLLFNPRIGCGLPREHHFHSACRERKAGEKALSE